MSYFLEAVNFTAGSNYVPNKMRYRLPTEKNNTSIYLLSDSYEYDVNLIKTMPLPKTEYKSIIIPFKIMDRIYSKPFRLILSTNEYNDKLLYLNNAKLFPKLTPVKYPYPPTIGDNLYISMSEVFEKANPYLRLMNPVYVRDHIFELFNHILGYFNFSKNKVLIIDTERYELYKTLSVESYKTDLINSLLTAYVLQPIEKIKPINVTIIFRSAECDYKFDLSKFKRDDVTRLKLMISKLGKKELDQKLDDSIEESLDDFTNDVEDESSDEALTVNEDDPDIQRLQAQNKSVVETLKSNIQNIKTSKTVNTEDIVDNKNKDKLFDSKVLAINTSLLKKITPDRTTVDSYQSIKNELTTSTYESSVETGIVDTAAKNLSEIAKPVNTANVLNSTSTPREERIRAHLGNIKLEKVNINNLSSVVDTPTPPPIVPLKITTTNIGAQRGTPFVNISKAYEDNMLDSDIVATFMNLSNLPDGYTVENIEVSDVSTVSSLIHNWRVTLKSKTANKQNVINVRIPVVKNGRFYNNGLWYNIGKQDFPIPVLKINDKSVILTSNYNKITVSRYDTRSLVNVSALRKVINLVTDDDGVNKYVKMGGSTTANNRFVSTIEYDELAKQWYSYIDESNHVEIYFNRVQCEKLYSFVSVDENEFCCGMIDQVPVVINTSTGLTRDDKTLSDLILSVMPPELVSKYNNVKPGKVSMYSEITIGIKLPLGVACAAWEGLTSFLKKSGCKYQFVDRVEDTTSSLMIPFKDKTLVIQNTVPNQLLFNGFFRINTKAYNIADFEIPIMQTSSIYIDIFNQIFFKQYSQLTTFITYYNFFMDVITKDVCGHYNIPDDLVGLLIYASNLLADNNYTTETKASLYRIRSTEIIPAILHYRLAYNISRTNNAVGSKSKINNFNFNPNEVINELLKVPNVSILSALNPMVEIHTRENVTRKGFRGMNSERAFSLDRRTYDESMIGKMAMSSPNDANIGINRQLVADPKIESVRGYTSTNGVETNFNDLQLASFSELLTPGTVSGDDAIRTSIATSQTSHIVSTANAAPVMISNGVDEIVPACVTDEFAVIAEEDGTVVEIKQDFMIVKYNSGKNKAINIGNRMSLNAAGFSVNNKLKPNFEEKDSFKKNDILAYHDKFFSKDSTGVVRVNIGPRLRVAFASSYATYEDGGMITRKASQQLQTSISMKQLIKLSATDDIEHIVSVGDDVEVGDPLVVFGMGDTGDKNVDTFLKAFSNGDNTNMLDTAKRIIKSTEAGKVIDVKMYTIKSMDKLSPSLFEILSDHFEENKKRKKILDKYDKSDSVYKLDTLYDRATKPLNTPSIEGINCDVLIKVYIEHADESSVGDKLVAYGASKQVTSEVIPEGLEPYSESEPDKEISMLIAPDSILKRMIPTVAKIAAGNTVLLAAKETIRKIWEE